MIDLELRDGRVLTFGPGPSTGISTGEMGFGSLREAKVASVRSDNFARSVHLKSGPDFILYDKDRPEVTIAVELKNLNSVKERRPDYLKSLQPQLLRYGTSLRASQGRDVPLQLWLLTGGELRVWEVDSRGEPHDERQYHLNRVSSLSHDGMDSIISGGDELTTEQIVRSVDDWEKRVRDLYDSVGEWSANLGLGLSANNVESVPMHEELMQRYAVPPRRLPVLSIRSESDELLSFKPYGLWVIGANGRIDVFSKALNYFLVDRAARFTSPEWQLYSSGERRILGRRLADGVNFTEAVFRELLVG